MNSRGCIDGSVVSLGLSELRHIECGGAVFCHRSSRNRCGPNQSSLRLLLVETPVLYHVGYHYIAVPERAVWRSGVCNEMEDQSSECFEVP
jgi:hypothetical protein